MQYRIIRYIHGIRLHTSSKVSGAQVEGMSWSPHSKRTSDALPQSRIPDAKGQHPVNSRPSHKRE